MKKLLAVMAVLFVIASMVFNVSAAVSPTVKCFSSKNEIKIGETVTITVVLENCPRIKTLGITPVYDDSAFELVSGEWLLKDGLIADFNKTTGDGAFTYTEDKDCNGEIFKYVLKAKAVSIFGDTTASVTAILQNSDYNSNISHAKTDVRIKTIAPETTPATTPATTPVTTPTTTPTTSETDETTAPIIENDTLESNDTTETAYEPIGTVDKTEEQTDKSSPEETTIGAIDEDKPMKTGSRLTVIIASIVAIAAIVGIVVIKVREKRL
ncbi:MAG: hypothetical protein IKU45_05930 [Clostridia bacterium]|nr:hypothetical protein [Clostridia bacterium]